MERKMLAQQERQTGPESHANQQQQQQYTVTEFKSPNEIAPSQLSLRAQTLIRPINLSAQWPSRYRNGYTGNINYGVM